MLVPTYDNKTIEVDLPLTGGRLLALPAVIDPHVHFRVPGAEHKETWVTGSRAAINGGVTTVFDMPNNTPAITSFALLQEKIKLIDAQLLESGIPLHYYLYLGATPDNEEEIKRSKNDIIGIKLFMGSSTGNLLVANRADQERIFQLAAELDLVVAVHAEDEALIEQNKIRLADNDSIKVHGLIRSNQVAATAVEHALEMAKQYGTKLYILHVSTKGELGLIRAAKADGINVFAETTPHHLFLNSEAYHTLGTKAQMNPPLRTPEDQKALWQAINDGTIDCIGTDHAPHTIAEKALPYPRSPSGVPGIETSLPLLLDSYNKGKLALETLVAITGKNARTIFNLPATNDVVIIDLDIETEVKNEDLKTKCGWSPFAGWKLKGWPVATILNGKTYQL